MARLKIITAQLSHLAALHRLPAGSWQLGCWSNRRACEQQSDRMRRLSFCADGWPHRRCWLSRGKTMIAQPLRHAALSFTTHPLASDATLRILRARCCAVGAYTCGL